MGQDGTFYGFVPYRHGPFSFALYRELESLKRDGYVDWSETSFALSPRTESLTHEQIERLTSTQTEAVDFVAAEYGRKRRPALLRDVYRRYPWYAINSELEEYLPDEVPAPPRRDVAAYTVGYEGKSVDGFFKRPAGIRDDGHSRHSREPRVAQVWVRQAVNETHRQ